MGSARNLTHGTRFGAVHPLEKSALLWDNADITIWEVGETTGGTDPDLVYNGGFDHLLPLSTIPIEGVVSPLIAHRGH